MTQEEKIKLGKKLSKKYNANITVGDFDTDYENDPFFVKKLEEAKALWNKIKFPEDFFDKKQPTPAVGM
nr:hypothetical protein [uncultured Capnocytophaga sp.]